MAFRPRILLCAALPAFSAGVSRGDEIGPMRPYVCDSARSSIAYTAVHPFATVHGRSTAPACTVWTDPDTVAFRVHVTVPVESFHSGIDLRDSHAMEAVDADEYPRAGFTSTGLTPVGGKVGPYRVTGMIDFHGRTRDVEMEIRPRLADGTAVIEGGFPISLHDYGVDPPSLLMFKTHDEAKISFHLVFNLPGGG